jgi:hypothetical protein
MGTHHYIFEPPRLSARVIGNPRVVASLGSVSIRRLVFTDGGLAIAIASG